MNVEPRKVISNIVVVTYAILFIVMLALLYFARDVVIISMIGIGIGVLIAPALTALHRRFKIPRALGAVVVILGLFLLIAGIGYGMFTLAAGQIASLTERGPQILARLQALAEQQMANYPWLRTEISSINVGAAAQMIFYRVLGGIQSGTAAISGLIFAGLLGIYAAIRSVSYKQSLVRAFPPRVRPKTEAFLDRSAVMLRAWFKAQLTDMVIIGAITAVGLWIVGVDYWFVFGILTAVFGIIPYVGIVLVVGIVSLITLASDPSQVPWVLLVFLITQQIEGNLVLPMVMRGQVELPEVPLLIFMLFLGSWLGLVGVFIAPPLLAVLRVAYEDFYLDKIEAGEGVARAPDGPTVPSKNNPSLEGASGDPLVTA
jgi:predicted PurR-regulated permease PerM